jgi:hypothetical protein
VPSPLRPAAAVAWRARQPIRRQVRRTGDRSAPDPERILAEQQRRDLRGGERGTVDAHVQAPVGEPLVRLGHVVGLPLGRAELGDPCAAKFFADAAVRVVLDDQENGLRDDAWIALAE